jgi:hypothetical protein
MACPNCGRHSVICGGCGKCVQEHCRCTTTERDPPVKWNPYNKVVQDHRDGTIDYGATNRERAKRGLPVP